MLHPKHSGRKALVPAGIALLCALGMSACGGPEGSSTPVATPQGTVELNKVKVGMPESTFRDAVITFIPDPNGSMGGKTQYLSRAADANGGQYVVQCKDGQSFLIQVTLSQPVPKEKGAAILQSLMPADAPAETKVENRVDKVGAINYTVETHQLGDKYKGELVSPDKGATVTLVNAYYLPVASEKKAAADTKTQ